MSTPTRSCTVLYCKHTWFYLFIPPFDGYLSVSSSLIYNCVVMNIYLTVSLGDNVRLCEKFFCLNLFSLNILRLLSQMGVSVRSVLNIRMFCLHRFDCPQIQNIHFFLNSRNFHKSKTWISSSCLHSIFIVLSIINNLEMV